MNAAILKDLGQPPVPAWFMVVRDHLGHTEGPARSRQEGAVASGKRRKNREKANFFTWPFEALIGRVGGSDEVCRSSGTDVYTPEQVRGRGAW